MEALWWEPAAEKGVYCLLCPHYCQIQPGKRGRCNVRENRDGMLIALNYGSVSAIALDPLEKKPLYHFYPGSQVLSVGSQGCNLDCGFCQNHAAVSGAHPPRETRAEEMVDLAAAAKSRGNIGLAWTYTEPLMWYEFVLDSARLAREQGLKTVLVTNGFINPKPWHQLLEYIDAVNIDIKSFRPEFYRRHCGGHLAPVLESVRAAVGRCHVEVTTLLIPQENTSLEELDDLTGFLADLSADIPLHLSRYYPARRWQRPATPIALVQSLAERARKQLNYVYAGNLPGGPGSTRCPKCDEPLVIRGENVIVNLTDDHCPRCKHRIPIILFETE